MDNSQRRDVVGEYAASVAKAAGGEVLATYVVDSRLVSGPFARLVGAELLGTGEDEALSALSELLRRHGQEALHSVERLCEVQGVRCQTRIEQGRPAQVIANMAPLYDLVVLGGRGEEETSGGCELGSTALELVRLATRPMMVVREEYRPISRVLVGYDGGPQATRAVDTIIGLAQRAGWALTLAVVADDARKGQTLAAQAETFRGLQELEHEVRVEPGNAPYRLLELIQEVGADLVAVGARGRGKLARFLLGSTSDLLLCEAPVPVVIFR